ncbi:UNVERIFIED_ORG: D-alanyl-D-alanine carboxypeptidase/D-alanyl-D-alanine-endopeptidase (penicillin-binding protein 4) [Actinomadura viridilutea]
MPKRTRALVMVTLSLLHVSTAGAGMAVAKLTPDRRLSPRPPAVAEREAVRTTATVVPLSAAGPAGGAPNSSVLARRLSGLLDGARTPINAVVVDVRTGRQLFARDADRPATPASTTKLVTSVAALAALGPDHRITTKVVRSGDGVVLVGGGDPTVTALPASAGRGRPAFASLADLARQTAAALKASGIRRVRVDYDATAYQGPRTAPGWKPNYIPDGEVAPVSALAVDEGRVAPGTTKKARVSDPPAAAAALFARMLTRNGVTATRGRAVMAPQGAAPLGTVQSPPLSVLVEHLMTESDNDAAEAVARQVAIKRGYQPSFAGAAQAVTDVLSELGAADGIMVNDGSGLSTRNRITPNALARLVTLAASDDRPELRAAITGMPVAGFSGTLSPPRYTTVHSAAGAGLVRAKTGTLAGVSTLAGFAHDVNGRLLAFAFMAGDGTGTVDPGRLDALAATVASCGCV